MQKGIMWKGKYFTLPQASSFIDSSALARTPLGGYGKLAIMGAMTGLVEPGKATKVGDPSLAMQLLDPATSEEARLAVNLAFDPTPGSEYQGASEVYLVPVNTPTPATLAFNNVVTLTSYLTGASANRLSAYWDRYYHDGATHNNIIITLDGVGSEIINMSVPGPYNLTASEFVYFSYTGSTASEATMNNTGTSLVFTAYGSDSAVIESESFTFDYATYPTLQDLISAVQNQTNSAYTATVADPAYNSYLVMLAKDAEVFFEPQSVHSVEGRALNFTSKTVADVINQKSQYAKAIYTRSTQPHSYSFPSQPAYFTGGSNGTIDTTAWQNALNALKSLDITFVLPLTDNAAYHALVESHCSLMSGPDWKMERRCFVGGALQTWTETSRATAVAALVSAATALNSDRAMLVGLGSYHYDPTGKLKLYPAYITAAMYAGLASGNGPVLPLTRKYLRCYGLEVDLRKSEIADLIDGAVAVPIPDLVNGAGYVISRQVTTWNQDTDLYRMEMSIGTGADYVAKEVRRRHELIIGKPGTEAIDQTILNMTNSVLQDCLMQGYIRSYDPKKTVLRVDNMTRYVDYEAVPIMPVNWIFSTYHLQALVLTITL